MRLTVDEARGLISKHLGTSSRAQHSVFVGFVMARLAQLLNHDPAVWEVVGLCHDLDYEETGNDRSKHGLVTASWLRDRLPPEALTAIEAHDHRTGVVSDTPVSRALKLADALAVIGEQMGERGGRALSSPAGVELGQEFANRPYVPRILLENASNLGIDLAALAEVYRAATTGPIFPR